MKTLLLTLFVLAIIVATVMQLLPNQFNPWGPVNVDEPVNFVTQFKLARLHEKPNQCFILLDQLAIEYEKIPDRETGQNCGFENTVRLLQSNVSYGGKIILTCPAMAALLLWEKAVLMPLSQLHFGQPLQRVGHMGTYNCRNINGRSAGRRSEHAIANAIDISYFVLQDGTRISLINDWQAKTNKSAFLKELRDGACKTFKTVLGPDYNRQHQDHFHLDMGSSMVCR